MKKIAAIILSLILFTSFLVQPEIIIDKQEAQNAFVFLNNIRKNPAKYYTELQLDKNSIIKNTALVWNDTLAKVAETKAADMAKRNYYNHIDPEGYGINYFINKSGYNLNPDWLKNNDQNYFESILGDSKNTNGQDIIKTFILDKGNPQLGHRKHLLGLDKWNASLVDIGIGIARRDSGSTFKTYVSVIIARHNW